jgi:hypothetical protein
MEARHEHEEQEELIPALLHTYERAKHLPKEQQEELAHVIELELAELTGTERPYSKQASMRRSQKWSAADDRYR